LTEREYHYEQLDIAKHAKIVQEAYGNLSFLKSQESFLRFITTGSIYVGSLRTAEQAVSPKSTVISLIQKGYIVLRLS
jgi:hypothetical protein